MKIVFLPILLNLFFSSVNPKNDIRHLKYFREPASTSDKCSDLIKNFNENSDKPALETQKLLGSGAGGTVHLITHPDSIVFVRKIYKSEKEFSNDSKALSFLYKIENSGQLNGIIKIIRPYNKAQTKNNELTALFEYYEGETLFDSINTSYENAESLTKQYNYFIKKLDEAINKSGKLVGRSEFPLFNSQAVHYQFSEFSIVIHVKNILVTKDGLVLIDPH